MTLCRIAPAIPRADMTDSDTIVAVMAQDLNDLRLAHKAQSHASLRNLGWSSPQILKFFLPAVEQSLLAGLGVRVRASDAPASPIEGFDAAMRAQLARIEAPLRNREGA